MATAKIATLLIRTIAKPISAQIKNQAKQHERFRNVCVSLAQMMYRSEVGLRTGILGEPAKHIRPLSETKAIENGANALAEGFLFSVAAALILGETYRTSRNQSKRRDDVDEKLDGLENKVVELRTEIGEWQGRWEEERQRNDDLARILTRVVEIGTKGGVLSQVEALRPLGFQKHGEEGQERPKK
ncbi:optic atrophy 3 protein-domain-containing protein [Rhodocollybia butyracea]|uniref:Optic atrophy 3 protein-domain-containing protein n=1 Tax=Rhodocollybia butyracea TaxID=206335 RepID=A0A9P5U0I1_9AGAR|nr:optic atrophy 3 protein-domain-containing protein [Rhodocollybia butyracea]